MLVSAWRRKVKKRKNTLLRGAERSKRAKTRFCTMQKGQKKKNYASAQRGKAKKRKITLLCGAERPKREKTRFCTARKGQKEKIIVSVNDISMEKVNFYASERLRTIKKKNYVEESGLLSAKREGDMLKRGFLKYWQNSM